MENGFLRNDIPLKRFFKILFLEILKLSFQNECLYEFSVHGISNVFVLTESISVSASVCASQSYLYLSIPRVDFVSVSPESLINCVRALIFLLWPEFFSKLNVTEWGQFY